jgi:hypothetical protein
VDSKQSSINRAMAEELDGERSSLRDSDGKKISVERFAAESGIAYSTMRRILAATVDVNVGDLLAMVGVINLYRRAPITSADLVSRAVERAGGMDKINAEFGITPIDLPPVSEEPATTDDLAARRRKQEAIKAMTPEEREGLRSAATTDPEFEQNEPDPT